MKNLSYMNNILFYDETYYCIIYIYNYIFNTYYQRVTYYYSCLLVCIYNINLEGVLNIESIYCFQFLLLWMFYNSSVKHILYDE